MDMRPQTDIFDLCSSEEKTSIKLSMAVFNLCAPEHKMNTKQSIDMFSSRSSEYEVNIKHFNIVLSLCSSEHKMNIKPNNDVLSLCSSEHKMNIKYNIDVLCLCSSEHKTKQTMFRLNVHMNMKTNITSWVICSPKHWNQTPYVQVYCSSEPQNWTYNVYFWAILNSISLEYLPRLQFQASCLMRQLKLNITSWVLMFISTWKVTFYVYFHVHLNIKFRTHVVGFHVQMNM